MTDQADQQPVKPRRKKTTPTEWLVLLAMIGACYYFFFARNVVTKSPEPSVQHKTLVSFGLQFVSCQPEGEAGVSYQCVVRAPEVMQVSESCAYFDAEHRVVGSPKIVSDLHGVRMLAGEERKVTVYAFDQGVATVQCNAVEENYRYDQMQQLLGELKPANKAWQISI